MIDERALLVQARQIVELDANRPKQVNLRRGIATSYYALFHALTLASSKLLISGSRSAMRAYLRRGYAHNHMKRVCKTFASGQVVSQLVDELKGQRVSPDVKLIADTFSQLQDARHLADYNHNKDYSKIQALELIEAAEAAVLAVDNLDPNRYPVEYAFLVALFADRVVY